jgi:hypothetical protein
VRHPDVAEASLPQESVSYSAQGPCLHKSSHQKRYDHRHSLSAPMRQNVVCENRLSRKHEQIHNRCKIVNSPRNDIAYQDAIESKWHSKELASGRLPTTKHTRKLHTPAFLSSCNGAVTSESPILEQPPETRCSILGACLDMEETRSQPLSVFVPWSVASEKLPFPVWLFTFFELSSRNAGNTNNAFATTSWLITRTMLVQTNTRGIGKDERLLQMPREAISVLL